MGAEFLEDESFPDGTHVQPGTKIIKKWKMRNNGTHPWNDRTKMKMVWGSMAPEQAQVSVPHLQVRKGEERGGFDILNSYLVCHRFWWCFLKIYSVMIK